MTDSPPSLTLKLARKFIEALPHAQALGMRLEELGDGRAVVSMPYDARFIGDPATRGVASHSLSRHAQAGRTDTHVRLCPHLLPLGPHFLGLGLLPLGVEARGGPASAQAKPQPSQEKGRNDSMAGLVSAITPHSRPSATQSRRRGSVSMRSVCRKATARRNVERLVSHTTRTGQ